MGVEAYHGLVCAVYSVRVSMCREVRGRTSLHMETRTEHTAPTNPWHAATPIAQLECSYL